jgi:hypothetical protein
MALYKRGKTYWYEFRFNGVRANLGVETVKQNNNPSFEKKRIERRLVGC